MSVQCLSNYSQPLPAGNDEREQTVNQLLTEMDGFESNKGVVPWQKLSSSHQKILTLWIFMDVYDIYGPCYIDDIGMDGEVLLTF